LGYPASDIGIDATQNGLFLMENLHTRFGATKSAFLRTPNFALATDDIPREVLSDPLAPQCTTLQHFVPYLPEVLNPVPQVDVQANWSGKNAPSTVLLDYAYGVAVIRQWATDDIQGVLNDRHSHYISLSNTSIPHDDEGNDSSASGESENGEYSEYVPSDQSGGPGISVSQAMDIGFQISMMLKGYPAGTTFEVLQQKREEEAQMHSQQIAKEKVRGWLQEAQM